MPLLRSLSIALILIMAGLPWEAATPAQALQDEAWHLVAMEGVVKVRVSPGEAFRPAKAGELLGPSPALQTGLGGKAMLFLPQGVVLALGEETLLEFRKQALSKPPDIPVTLMNGTLHFAVDLSDNRQFPQVMIFTPTSRVMVRRGTGFLVSAGQDRLIGIEGSTISIANQISGRRLAVGPWQVAISEKNGILQLSRVQPSEMDQLLVKTRVAPATPPLQVLKPPSPVLTPITLAEQVKQPWPVFPPVIQSPNIWIMEALRPHPRP